MVFAVLWMFPSTREDARPSSAWLFYVPFQQDTKIVTLLSWPHWPVFPAGFINICRKRQLSAYFVGFDVLTAVAVMSTIFWYLTSYCLVEFHQHSFKISANFYRTARHHVPGYSSLKRIFILIWFRSSYLCAQLSKRMVIGLNWLKTLANSEHINFNFHHHKVIYHRSFSVCYSRCIISAMLYIGCAYLLWKFSCGIFIYNKYSLILKSNSLSVTARSTIIPVGFHNYMLVLIKKFSKLLRCSLSSRPKHLKPIIRPFRFLSFVHPWCKEY